MSYFFTNTFVILLILYLSWSAYRYLVPRPEDTVEQLESLELLWNIPDAPEKLKDGYSINMTNHFPFASHKWYLELESKDEYITINLKKNDSLFSSTEKIYWGVGIKVGTDDALLYWFSMKQETDLGSSNWNSKKVWILKRYLLRYESYILPNKVLTIFLRISTYPLPFRVMPGNTEALNTLSKNLKDFYLEEKNFDVRIIVGRRIFGAHRTILKARSPVLFSMLKSTTGMIRVGDCDPEHFSVFLIYLYSGSVDNLNIDNVIPVYIIANKYDEPELMEMCTRYMLSTLNVHSFSNVIALALKHGERNLLANATPFLLEHAEEIFATVEWEKFLSENPIQANEFLKKSYSNRK